MSIIPQSAFQPPKSPVTSKTRKAAARRQLLDSQCDSGATRTRDPQLRRLLLYPTELRSRNPLRGGTAKIIKILYKPHRPVQNFLAALGTRYPHPALRTGQRFGTQPTAPVTRHPTPRPSLQTDTHRHAPAPSPTSLPPAVFIPQPGHHPPQVTRPRRLYASSIPASRHAARISSGQMLL